MGNNVVDTLKRLTDVVFTSSTPRSKIDNGNTCGLSPQLFVLEIRTAGANRGDMTSKRTCRPRFASFKFSARGMNGRTRTSGSNRSRWLEY